MMKHEFEDRLGRGVSADEYKIIEYVYTWHPAFENMEAPKQSIADLYKTFGMSVIKGMVEISEATEKLTQIETKLQRQLIEIREQKEMLKNGDMPMSIASAEEVEK